MLFLRFKQCECSLKDGLLDEAFELARSADFCTHRHGQRLINRLAAALIDRSRQHLAAGRLSQASMDCEKAGFLAGNLTEIAQLRLAISRAIQNAGQAKRINGQALALARRHADCGQLTLGQNILDAVEAPDEPIRGLKQDLAARRAAAESCVSKAANALRSGDWQTAADHVAAVGRVVAQDASIRQMYGQIVEHGITEIEAAITEGRLDLAAGLLKKLERLPTESVQTQVLARALADCRTAYSSAIAGHAADAEQTLRRLRALWPNAHWLDELIADAQKIVQSLANFQASPLSLLSTPVAPPPVSPTAIPPPISVKDPKLKPAPTPQSNSYVLHVDGIGSFQILTSPQITLGSPSSSRSVDVPLMIDASVPAVRLSRLDEDYFLQSSRPISVNDHPVEHRLLSDGDRIGMGRCRITFRRPSAASASAVLDLAGTRTPGSAVRQVILLDRELIIGPGAAAHVRCDDLSAPIFIQQRGEELICRSATKIDIDGNPAGQSTTILLGAHITIGSVRFVLVREQRS